MPISGAGSVVNEDFLFAGFWESIYAIKDPLTAPVRHEIGVVSDGVLRVSREETEFLGTTFPRVIESVVPTRVDMQFAGTANELRAGLLHYLVGDAAIDDPSNYIYPAAGCAFSDIDVRLIGERINCAELMIVFVIWQARSSGSIEIGGADGFIGTPMEINALNDKNGNFGGSAAAPLGFIWLTHD